MDDDRLLVCFRCSHLPHDKGECSECDCYVVSGGVSFIKQWENAHGVAPPGQGWSVTFREGIDGRVIPDAAVLVNLPGYLLTTTTWSPPASGNVLKFMPPGHFCPDVCGIEDFGDADHWRGRVVRAFFTLMRAWPKPRPTTKRGT